MAIARCPLMTHTALRALLLVVPISLVACAEAPLEGVESSNGAFSGSIEVGDTLTTTARLNLREGPSLDDEVILTMPSGAKVTALDEEPEDGFYHVSYDGEDGWAYGKYLTIPGQAKSDESKSDAPPPPPGPAGEDGNNGGGDTSAILAKLSGCASRISSSPYAKDSGGSPTIDICQRGSAVYFTADLDVDCDGKSSSVCSKATDPYYQSQTAGLESNGSALNPATLPFIVVPGVSSRWSYSASGISMGTVAAVIYNGRIEYGIVGDVGPTSIIGEASYAMAKSLGINPSPSSGGTSSGVTYVIFPGTRVSRNEDHNAAVSLGQQRIQELLDD